MIAEANEYMLDALNQQQDDDDHPKPPSEGGTSSSVACAEEKPENEGTLILDATCVPANIRYPQVSPQL